MIVTQSEAMSPRAKRKPNGGQDSQCGSIHPRPGSKAAERFARGFFDTEEAHSRLLRFRMTIIA